MQLRLLRKAEFLKVWTTSLARREWRGFSFQLAALLIVLWFSLAGLEGWRFGLLAVVIALAASAWLAPMQLVRFSPPGLVRFLLFFLHYSLLGGLDVAWRALRPAARLRIHDAHFRFRLPQGQARSVFIGTVSLLPGTLARELDGDTLRVHSIAGDPAPELERLEVRIADLFGLELPTDDQPTGVT